MDSSGHTCFTAQDRSYVAILKKEIHSIILQVGFSAKKVAETDIIIAEMTSNLIKHGGGGEILVRLINNSKQTGIELISIDNGPGMTDPQKMVEDGVSTTNTLGQGLGAIKRLSDVFQIYSLKNWGTVVLSRLYTKAAATSTKPFPFELNGVQVPKPGEEVCGDGFAYTYTNHCLKVLLGDGLGHGIEANHAINEAIKAFKLCLDDSPANILRFIHAAVKKTRGLVGTVLVYNFKEKKWRICGIGNITTRMQTFLNAKNYMAYNGIIGLNIPNTMKDQEILPEPNQLLLMCSDGIRSRWDTTKYPAIMKYDLSILAAALYKDFARKNDDMSVIVGRITNGI